MMRKTTIEMVRLIRSMGGDESDVSLENIFKFRCFGHFQISLLEDSMIRVGLFILQRNSMRLVDKEKRIRVDVDCLL